MRFRTAVALLASLVASVVLCDRLYLADAQRRAQPPNASGSAPVFVPWPQSATGKAYGTIDGKHLWQYVKEQADIARRYRDRGIRSSGAYRGHIRRR